MTQDQVKEILALVTDQDLPTDQDLATDQEVQQMFGRHQGA
jgi:hypothetical protein